jgi:hypothetical protein
MPRSSLSLVLACVLLGATGALAARKSKCTIPQVEGFYRAEGLERSTGDGNVDGAPIAETLGTPPLALARESTRQQAKVSRRFAPP